MKTTNNNKAVRTNLCEAKIDDLCAEYGMTPHSVAYRPNIAPNSFIVGSDKTNDGVAVLILAEDELHEHALCLAEEKIFDDLGFIDMAPEEADFSVDSDRMSSIIHAFYSNQASRLAKINSSPYPNELARACVANDIISDNDLDRYFDQDCAWLDSQAEHDLCETYARVMTNENLCHSVTWLREHLDTNGHFWRRFVSSNDIIDNAAIIKNILKERHLIDMAKAAPLALDWQLKNGNFNTECDFISSCDGEMKPVGEFYGFCNDWDRVRTSCCGLDE